MNKEKQRIAIAEACGWEKSGQPYTGFDGSEVQWWKNPKVLSDDTMTLPNYPNDLNAMHEAVKCLTEQQRHGYSVLLSGKLWEPEHSRGWECWRDTFVVSEATAAQRAEAFLKTIGKWSDQ